MPFELFRRKGVLPRHEKPPSVESLEAQIRNLEMGIRAHGGQGPLVPHFEARIAKIKQRLEEIRGKG